MIALSDDEGKTKDQGTFIINNNTINMSTTTAQRRGKPSKIHEPTILVENNNNNHLDSDNGSGNGQHHHHVHDENCNHSHHHGHHSHLNHQSRLTAASGSALVPTATVHRRSCGTGPFDKHWLNLDCCGLTCAVFTYMLHMYGVYAVCFILLPPWMSYQLEIKGEEAVAAGLGAAAEAATVTSRYMTLSGHFNQIAFTTIAVLAVMSHFKAMTTDPGAVPPDAKPLPEITSPSTTDTNKNSSGLPVDATEGDPAISTVLINAPIQEALHPPKTMRLCRRCKAYKPQRAHHCSVCRRCIIKMDHHCPWVNNCVGLGNHKYFLLFVFYTFLSCLYSIALIIARFTTCMSVYKRHQPIRSMTCLDQPQHLLYILGLLVEAILFGMFTCCMMCDQFEVIHSKMTHIDRLKGMDFSGSLPGILEVFGIQPAAVAAESKGEGKANFTTRFRPDWLSPLHNVCFPESLQDEVFGFCRPISSAMMCSKMKKNMSLFDPTSPAADAAGSSGTPSKEQRDATANNNGTSVNSTSSSETELASTRLSDTV